MIDANKRDRIVAAVLRWGAYGSFVIVVVGILLGLKNAQLGSDLVRAGLLLLIATPVSRIVALLITFALALIVPSGAGAFESHDQRWLNYYQRAWDPATWAPF